MSQGPAQLALPFAPSPSRPEPRGTGVDTAAQAARRLRGLLEARTGEALHLTVTDNRRSIVTVRRRPDGVQAVRVHHIFLDADAGVLRSLARYILSRDRTAARELGHFIAAHRDTLARSPRARRAVLVRTRGRHHDLQALYDDLNHQYFGGAVNARITWGPASSAGGGRRRRSSIRLGTYAVEERLIRIHPKLDADWVPSFFVAWIVYHEMLHHALGIRVDDGGRRAVHPPEFRARERDYARYDEAQAWERAYIDRLLA